MNKRSISVWGSCVSRDIFNRIFIPNYKDYFQVVHDQQHVSVISLMSKPLNIDLSNVQGNVTDFYKNVFKQDMTKEYLKKLKKESPEYLLVDFYADVLYGVKRCQSNKYITNKVWQYKKLNSFQQISIEKEFSIYQNTEVFIDLWKKSFDRFIQYMDKVSPETQIIVNKARFVNRYYDPKEKKYKHLSDIMNDRWEPFHINRFNLMWELLDTYAIEKYHLHSLDFDSSQYECKLNHQWGKFYVHYNDQYYADVFDKLKKVTKKSTQKEQRRKFMFSLF